MVQKGKEEENNANPRYTAEDIYVLEGLEPVRRRPGMYIGSTGVDGLHHLVWEIFDNSRDEAMGNFATEIEVAILPGNVVRVADDGRGIPVDIHQKTKVSALETALTTLHAGGKFGGSSYKISGGLHGVGASVVNALSLWLKAEVHKDGGVHFQEYKQGQPKAKVKKIGDTKQHGTIVTFAPDPEIFSALEFDFQKIKDHLRQQAYLVRGMKVRIIDARGYEGKIDESAYYLGELNLPVPSHTLYFEGGIVSMIKHLNRDEEPIHENIFYVDKIADRMMVETALQYVTDITSKEISFANNISTGEGGTHLTGFRAALTRVLNDYARKNGFLKEAEDNLSGDDVREGLIAVISVKLPEPQFEGQTKAKLGSIEGRTAVETVVSAALADFLEERPQDARAILGKCILAQKARKAAKAARETVLRKGALEGFTLPGKLSDCSSRKAEDSELYIVEGDSAGGCFSGDTKIALADGRSLNFYELMSEQDSGIQNYCYTIKQDGGIAIEAITNIRKTKSNTSVIKITLDNDEEIICTPDHKFMLRNGSYREARYLTSDDSLMPLRRQYSKIGKRITIAGYEMVYDLAAYRWIFTHMLADQYNLIHGIYKVKDGAHRHHKNFNKLNNNPNNITRLSDDAHLDLHRQFAKLTLQRPEVIEKLKVLRQTKKFRDYMKQIMSSPKMRRLLSERAKKQWQNEDYKKYMAEKFLEFYHSNQEYREKNNSLLNSSQKEYWSKKENRCKQAERVTLYFKDNPEKRNKLSNKAKEQWSNPDLVVWRKEQTRKQWTDEFRAKRKLAYNRTYLNKGLKLLKFVYDKYGKLDENLYDEERRMLNDKSIIKLATIKERFFGNDETRLREAVFNFNHKIKSIIQLSEKIDVYDIEVPETHNFALANGVFVHNSAKQGRDRRFQAILPLRGKILNIERARLDKILASSEIKALIIAMGTAIADEFDIKRLRYHRIIIMTDADVDGAHIRTLLLTLFYRYFSDLINSGYIYIAQPPLYRIQAGKKVEYAYADADKERIVAALRKDKGENEAKKAKKPAKAGKEEADDEDSAVEKDEEGNEKIKGVSIQRYKGLGEMNPDQLWTTTMDPENRVLKRVTVADAQEADKIFDILMGADVLPRKRFIQSRAKDVKNLDV